ncbi:hypothetical protein ACIBCO_39245, partial [Streptomyces violascens]|uniref:hypothetical protein n=1 Tax=Streptomyces violascens TaxID=67381 RepID=UPI0037B64454
MSITGIVGLTSTAHAASGARSIALPDHTFKVSDFNRLTYESPDGFVKAQQAHTPQAIQFRPAVGDSGIWWHTDRCFAPGIPHGQQNNKISPLLRGRSEMFRACMRVLRLSGLRHLHRTHSLASV